MLENNIVKHAFLECIEKSLFNLQADRYLQFPRELVDRYRVKEKTYSDVASLHLLYQSGEIFNHDRFIRSIHNWYENRGSSRQIHHEAWKGKIIGKISLAVYTGLVKLVNKYDPPDMAHSFAREFHEWKRLFEKHQKAESEKNKLLNLSLQLDEILTKKIEQFDQHTNFCGQMIKDAIKTVCSDTLIWIHYKNVRYVYKKLMTD